MLNSLEVTDVPQMTAILFCTESLVGSVVGVSAAPIVLPSLKLGLGPAI